MFSRHCAACPQHHGSGAVQTERSARAHSAASTEVGALIESLLMSSRERTRGVTEALLDRVSALSTKTPEQLSGIAASAATAAWRAAAAAAASADGAAQKGSKSQQLLEAGGGAGPRARRDDAAQQAEAKRSWFSFVAGSAAACSAAFQVVSDATRPVPPAAGADSHWVTCSGRSHV